MLHVVAERDPGPERGRLDPKRERRPERVGAQGRAPSGDVRVGLRVDHLLGLARPSRALDAHGRRLAEVRGDAVVALQRRLDDLLLDLAVERHGDLVAMVVLADVDQRVLLGELGERRAEAALLLRSQGEDDRLERRAWEAGGLGLPRRRLADRIPHPDGTQAPDGRHLARREVVAPRGAGRGEDLDRRRLRLLAAPDPDALAGPERAGEQANVGDPLPCLRALDLEHAARDVGLGIPAGAGQQLVDRRRGARRSPGHARPSPSTPGARGPGGSGPRGRRAGAATRARARRPRTREDRFVVLRERLGQGRVVRLVDGRERHEGGSGRAGVADPAHRDHAGRQASRQLGDDASVIGTSTVDLVDEDQGRDVEPLERAEQERGLRLDALDRRDDQDGAVEHAEDAFDLRDEVGVARRVDEVDREVAHEERGDRGPDGDAAFALEVERVGLGGAGVDAADVVDGAGGEEEPLGEGGLTGVDVGEDSEIERFHGASCRTRRWSPSGWS